LYISILSSISIAVIFFIRFPCIFIFSFISLHLSLSKYRGLADSSPVSYSEESAFLFQPTDRQKRTNSLWFSQPFQEYTAVCHYFYTFPTHYS
jgi:hypothetical protein